MSTPGSLGKKSRAHGARGHDHAEVTQGHGAAGHDHEHEHGSSVWSRIRHGVSEVHGAHSHDSANQVDETLEADADGRCC